MRGRVEPCVEKSPYSVMRRDWITQERLAYNLRIRHCRRGNFLLIGAAVVLLRRRALDLTAASVAISVRSTHQR
jgi:hypothetical protein